MNTMNTILQNDTNYGAKPQIMNAIQNASAQSGVDFAYLVNQAKAESSFNPTVKSKTSSATGLYQFIDSTWMDMVNKYGTEYGIDTQGMTKREILNMRKDPEAASFMAAAFASENEKSLNANWGGDVGATELYFAHFLGASGASSFLKAKDSMPLETAATLFPKAANANYNVFYDRETGKPRSIAQVYDFFDAKFKDSPKIAPQPVQTTSESLLAAAPTKDHRNAMELAAMTPKPRHYGLSDGVIMQRAQAMRNAAESNSTRPTTVQLAQMQHEAFKTQPVNPFKGLVHQPVDLMFLTQRTQPSKVLRDVG